LKLAPEQQARLKAALGDYFQYKIRSIQQILVDLDYQHKQPELKKEK